MIHKYNIKFGRHGRLHGLLLLPNIMHPVPGAILCHGLGSGQGAVRPCALSIARQGIITLIFDFRGHGQSEGIFDGGEVEDVIEAWQWLAQFDGIDRRHIAFIGHSMGAKAAILAACEVDSPRAVVLLACPPDPDRKLSQDDLLDLSHWTRKGKVLMEYPKDGLLPWVSGAPAITAWLWMYLRGYKLRINWESYFLRASNMKISTALQSLGGCSKLFVHCQGDKRTPYQATIDFYQKAPMPKDLLLAKGGYHSTPLLPGNLRKKWISWVVNVLTAGRKSHDGSETFKHGG